MSVEAPLIRDILNGILNSRIEGSQWGAAFPSTAQTAYELAAGVTPTNYDYEPLDIRRYASNAQWSSVYNQVNTLAEYNDWARREHSLHPSETNCIVGFGTYNDSLQVGTIGYRCTAFGVSVLANNSASTVAGGSNCAFGYLSQQTSVDTSGNCTFGVETGRLMTGVVSAHNNAFGHQGLAVLTTGTQNNAFGYRALFSLDTGDNNSAFGESALFTMTSGDGNSALGYQCLFSKTTGDFATAFGYQACFSETTAVGNSGFGYRVLFSTVTGGNTVMGYDAVSTNAAGINNSAFGYEAGKAINAGEYNCVGGYQSGLRITSGGSNTCWGQQSGNFITTGSENVCVGNSAGVGVATGSRCVAIGGASLSTGDRTNTICVGWNAQDSASNQINLGDTNITQIRAQVTVITAYSDEHYKIVHKMPSCLDFIRDVEIIRYEWNNEASLLDDEGKVSVQEDGQDWPEGSFAGVGARALDACATKHGFDWMGLVDKSNKNAYLATPGLLLFPLIRAFQEQAVLVDQLRERLSSLEAA